MRRIRVQGRRFRHRCRRGNRCYWKVGDMGTETGARGRRDMIRMDRRRDQRDLGKRRVLINTPRAAVDLLIHTAHLDLNTHNHQLSLVNLQVGFTHRQTCRRTLTQDSDITTVLGIIRRIRWVRLLMFSLLRLVGRRRLVRHKVDLPLLLHQESSLQHLGPDPLVRLV